MSCLPLGNIAEAYRGMRQRAYGDSKRAITVLCEGRGTLHRHGHYGEPQEVASMWLSLCNAMVGALHLMLGKTSGS